MATDTQTKTLFAILEWTRENGEVKAVDRLCLRVMKIAMQEGLVFSQVNADTDCSKDALLLIRNAASGIVGQQCPF